MHTDGRLAESLFGFRDGSPLIANNRTWLKAYWDDAHAIWNASKFVSANARSTFQLLSSWDFFSGSPDSGPNFVRQAAPSWNTGTLLTIAPNCPIVLPPYRSRASLSPISHNIALLSRYDDAPWWSINALPHFRSIDQKFVEGHRARIQCIPLCPLKSKILRHCFHARLE